MIKHALFKRALPMMLSVAMMFQSLPATALAAEYEETTETVEETETETTAEETENDADAEDNADAQSETETDKTDASETETTEAETIETEDAEVEEADAEQVQNDADNTASTVTAEITVNLTDYSDNNITITSDKSGVDTIYTATVTYKQKEENPFKGLTEKLSNFVSVNATIDRKNSTDLTYNLVYTWQKGTESDDGAYTYADMSTVPQATGVYRLEITLDSELDGTVDYKPAYINCVIEQATLTIGNSSTASGLSGMTVAEVKALYAESLTVSCDNGESLDYTTYLTDVSASIFTVRKAGSGDACDYTVTLKKGDSIVIETNAALADDYTDNYTIKQYSKTVEITELKAVTLALTTPNLDEGIDISYTYNKEAIEQSVVYTEAEVAAATDENIILPVVTVDGVDTDGDGEDDTLTVTAENFTEAWFDANGGELDGAPTEAGAYYYQLTYTDSGDDEVFKNIYADATAQVKVVIAPVSLVVRPVPTDSSKTYQVYNYVTDLLKNISYQLYTIGEDGTYSEFTIPEGEENSFWGVAYSNDSIPQFYAPVFEVQQRTTTVTTVTTVGEDNKEETTTEETTGSWSEATEFDYTSGEQEPTVKEETDSDGNVTKTTTTVKTVEYRVIFTGKVAVYENGVANSETEVDVNSQINSADTNYEAYTTTDIVEADDNVVSGITVNDSTEVTIDVSKIREKLTAYAVNSIEDENETYTLQYPYYSKVYDGTAFFADRSEYKLATTGNDDADEVGTFHYSWYLVSNNAEDEWNYSGVLEYNEETEEYECVKDSNGNILYEIDDWGGWIYTNYNLDQLANAGKYVLVISYEDDTNTYYADEEKYLYFNIDEWKQLVKATPGVADESALTVYSSNTIGTFLTQVNNSADFTYVINTVEDNLFGEGETLGTTNLADEWEYEEDYGYTWVVLEADNVDADKAVYGNCGQGNTYTSTSSTAYFNKDLTYKLGIRIDCYLDDYTNKYTPAEDAQVQDKYYFDVLTINVVESAEKELEIVWDSSMDDDFFEKEYSGETAFDLDTLISEGYITARIKNTDTAVDLTADDAPALNIKWLRFTNKNNYSTVTKNPGYYSLSSDSVVDYGYYCVYISFEGDETYAAFTDCSPETDLFVVDPKELTVDLTDALADANIKAGMKSGGVSGAMNWSAVKVTGYIDADADAFNNGVGVGAFSSLGLSVLYEGSYYSLYLRYHKTYTVSPSFTLNNEELHDGVSENYTLVYTGKAFTVNERGTSSVDGGNVYVTADYSGGTYTIAPAEGIPYYYAATENDTIKTSDGESLPAGNYLTITITAPNEFVTKSTTTNGKTTYTYDSSVCGSVVYKNSVLDSLGYVTGAISTSGGTITLAFPVSDDKDSEYYKGKERKFTILWEELDGETYSEDFVVNLSKAQLVADLTSAVAPKTLAFNGVTTKMVAGETQQLDVKMTKTLSSDVVYLNYEVISGGEYLTVTEETGIVTAVKKGSATVRVYPVKYNASTGEYEEISFKSVTTKITVSDVTAPKISSVYAYDTNFDITYTVPSDGYRREIYVLAGKKSTKDFETAIAGAEENNNDYSDFAAYAFVTTDTESEYYSSTKKAVVVNSADLEMSSLEVGTDYTVYVRNVSAVREVDGGEVVDYSRAGAVKTFKTTLKQPTKIRLVYASEDQAKLTTEEKYKLSEGNVDEIDLSVGSIQLQAQGLYYLKDTTQKEYADATDYEWKNLPLGKDDLNTGAYASQKLTYYALADLKSYSVATGAYKTKIGDRYYQSSGIAKIDKNGKLTLKGVGYVYIVAYDSVSKQLAWYHDNDACDCEDECECDDCNGCGEFTTLKVGSYREEGYGCNVYKLLITSDIAGITAKNPTIKVGSSVNIYDYLTFTNSDKKKLTGDLRTLVELLADNGKLTVSVSDESVVSYAQIYNDYDADEDDDYDGEWLITALKANAQATLDISVVVDDKTVASTGAKPMTVKTKAMDAVKSLKASYVVDNFAEVKFSHTNSSLMFRVEFTDGRGRTISSTVEEMSYESNGDREEGWSLEDVLYADDGMNLGYVTVDEKGVYWYTLGFTGLDRQSTYNVTITPVYDETYADAAKSAKTKFTTTNIPAYKGSDEEDNSTYLRSSVVYGGMKIYIDDDEDETYLGSFGYLTSGNTYTLVADANEYAKNRQTDTLTWKSSNTKVATVKANTGSYSAALKATGVGTTYIEVTSKVTKLVIARWIVRVKSVSNGGENAWGDTEPINPTAEWDTDYDKGILVLTEANTVTLPSSSEYDYYWVSFTAPADGDYTFTVKKGYFEKTYKAETDEDGKETTTINYTCTKACSDLSEGETVYLKVTSNNGSYATVSVTGA